MITNNKITYYHKILNNETKLEEWERHFFNNVWVFIRKGSNVNAGLEKNNNIDVRIPFIQNVDIFHIGDIIAVGEQGDIQKQSDLGGKEFYNVTSVNINNFGNNPHIHLGGQ